MDTLLRRNHSRFQASAAPDDWCCEECGKREGYFNWKSRACSEECARDRKSRLQRERRHSTKKRKVTVRFVARHSGS